MRDRFLFRGKRVDNGKLIVGCLCNISFGGEGSYISSSVSEYSECFNHINNLIDDFNEVDPKTIGQCTGLKDKNGKMIFEGDVVISPMEHDSQHQETINFNKEACSFWWGGWCISRAISNGCEIIGTIHDGDSNDV